MSQYNSNGYDNQNSNGDYYSNHPQQYQTTYQNYTEVTHAPPPAEHLPEDGNRGLLGAVGGGISGTILGKQTNHGFLGSVGGALVGSLAEDFLKKRSRPSSPQPPTSGVAAAAATATANATNNNYYGATPLATPASPPAHPSNYCAPAYPSANQTSTITTTVNTNSYFQQQQQPPCYGTAHPCAGTVHHCWSSTTHAPAPQHGHGWSHWHK